jgi:hypothetical protein
VENWHTLSLQQKKIIAGYFIQNITVTDSEVNIHYKISL